MRRPLRLLLACIPLLAACAAPPALAPAPGVPVTAALVDSIPWQTEMTEGVLHRVEVRTGARADTIAGVLAELRPVVVAGEVLGYASDTTGGLAHAFRYAPRTRVLERLPLADDIHGAWSVPAISPDGRYVAYVVVPGDGTAMARVRAFPAGAVAVRGPVIPIPAGDVMANDARWTGPDVFEVSIDLADRWARVRGTVSAGVTAVDTVSPPRHD